MTVREFVTYIQRKTQYQSEEILALLNDVITFIYGKNCRKFLYIDPSTGEPPYLTTNSGQYNYTFPDGTYDVGVRGTSAVLCETVLKTYELEDDTYFYQNKEYYRIKLSADEDRWDTNNPAELTFSFDPGNTTTQYFHLFYRQAPEITSISSNMTIPIPPGYHLQLRRIILALLNEEDYGATTWDYIEKKLAAKIWQEKNAGASDRSHVTPIRPEYRTYRQRSYRKR